MTNNFFRKPESKEVQVNIYETLGLKQNPFPIDPAVKPYSKDERENGTIYLTSLREEEIRQFKNIVVHQPNKISLLMDFAAYRGRGIGKTAFLNYEKKQINSDLGYQLSDGKRVLYSLYVCPGGDKKERKFWQIARLIYGAIEQEDLLRIAFCRLRANTGLVNIDKLNASTNEEAIDKISNDQILRDININVEELNRQVTEALHREGIEVNLRHNVLFTNTFDSFSKQICDNQTDVYWRKHGSDIIFNKLVKLLKLAEFSNCIILFDEAEKIITAQNFAERREFCDNLRHYFIDGTNENANSSFFKLLMTIHPNSQELLLTHWAAAGLERFSELGGEKAQHNTVFFKPLQNKDLAIALAVEYLNNARLDPSAKGATTPFSKDCLELAHEKAEGIPGKYLKLLYTAIEKAIQEKWTSIDSGQIDQIWKSEINLDSLKKEIPVQLPETKTKLD